MITPGIVPHCDEPGCDLGSLQYYCPQCGKHITDYDNWWNQDQKTIDTVCPHCKHTFTMKGFGNDE